MDATQMMTDSNESQVQERLGFHEIVPGHRPDNTETKGADWVPEFDLGRQMMARHRRATAQRRRPPQTSQAEPVVVQDTTEQPIAGKQHRAWLTMTDHWSSVVADIVSQDIAALYRGEQVYC